MNAAIIFHLQEQVQVKEHGKHDPHLFHHMQEQAVGVPISNLKLMPQMFDIHCFTFINDINLCCKKHTRQYIHYSLS